MSDNVTPSPVRKCLQPECTFGEDSKCLEGLRDPLSCPHLVLSSDKESESLDVPENEPNDEEYSIDDWLFVPEEYELDLASAARITSAYDARLIVVAGEPDAGKTTLISSLYEMFCRGPFASFQFAGSETLLAFERVCHLSRTSSGAEDPDTERTKGTHTRYFHLVLRELPHNQQDQHLLITDVSGEAYKRAINHSDDAKKLGFIRRADVFVLLLDGKRLALTEERQEVFRRGLLLLRTLNEVGILDRRSVVRLALSKCDLLLRQFVDQNTVDFLDYLRSEFRKFAENKFKSFSIVDVAARPLPGRGFEYAYGVDLLLKFWLQGRPVSMTLSSVASEQMGQTSREADTFLKKHFGQ